MNHDHIRVVVAEGGTESVPARRVDDGRWELLRSPLYAMGVAAGDIGTNDGGNFTLVRRGGNVCVQIYLGPQEADDREATARLASCADEAFGRLGGRVDGNTAGLVCVTAPVSSGFPGIEQAANQTVEAFVDAQWQYGNVYDSDSGEPLAWWT